MEPTQRLIRELGRVPLLAGLEDAQLLRVARSGRTRFQVRLPLSVGGAGDAPAVGLASDALEAR